jgi:ubiquinone/menaquinone biosynthesis C-methylase UbiE
MSIDKKRIIDQEELKNTNPEEYERKYVHDTYNKIASHFSATRYRPWPQVESFLKSLSPDSIMVDVGCGNGKNLGISPGISFGCDICPKLLDIARERGHNVIQCDALALPYEDNFADTVISIAVIHHFVTEERRISAIQEMLRILKLNGRMLIYVWANEKEGMVQNDCFVGWEKNCKQLDENDKDIIHKRYYHFFNTGELEDLCLRAGNCIIERSYFDKENWAVIVQKI